MQKAKHENRDDPGAFNEEMHRRLKREGAASSSIASNRCRTRDVPRARPSDRPLSTSSRILTPPRSRSSRCGWLATRTLAKSKSLVSGDPILRVPVRRLSPCSLAKARETRKARRSDGPPWAQAGDYRKLISPLAQLISSASTSARPFSLATRSPATATSLTPRLCSRKRRGARRMHGVTTRRRYSPTRFPASGFHRCGLCNLMAKRARALLRARGRTWPQCTQRRHNALLQPAPMRSATT